MKRLLLLVATLCFALQPHANANEISKWTNLTLQAVRMNKQNPPIASRQLALVNIVMFDSINAILQEYNSFHYTHAAPNDLIPEVAAAQAAHDMLTRFYPADERLWRDHLLRTLTAYPNGPQKDESIALGKIVSENVFMARSRDLKNSFLPDYRENILAMVGEWIPTAPGYLPALLPNWGLTTPLGMLSPSQFRQDGPPPFYSFAYALDYNEVKNLGPRDSRHRTTEQTQIARFWEDGLGTITPPGHWNRIALNIASKERLSLIESSRLMTLLNISMADSAVSAWDMKYVYNCWRPITAIKEAHRDNNNYTQSDADWMPLLTTPPFPDYVSGHSTFSGAGAQVLATFFGSDEYTFSSQSEGLPGVVRHFHRFSQAAEEAGRSRVYGGIHYEFANRDGLKAGRQIAQFVTSRLLLPVR